MDIHQQRKRTVFVICGLLLLLPYGKTLSHSSEHGLEVWTYIFIFSHRKYGLLMSPLLLSLLMVVWMDYLVHRRFFIFLSLLFSGIYSLATYLLFFLGAPGFQPTIGAFFMLALFPILIFIGLVEWRPKSKES